ncbi:tRNA (adenosine(37)-N6)-dimethylallyltransferase MiaA [Herbinix luporum]|jgi:tRNA dimethylallyltransferase|uniref:tRNA dimethylallyltransferase n=1 Tax=Herbinix luporum TaxID=1679721 RepID=A0A0K8J5E8_9FIRM|nr:tRNA (adenosine(37)-N6)-dimethylallyltransferase MiaA [Herbinix luporum]CUH92685.1 tRNA dimethylallyltransferase [Herbinix luporum]HHT56677.1 tRNA (adenosine(37)-N6)-dimethylallyltransferase MiaA [Herbinix luporum]
MDKKPLIILTGPTSVGKTSLSIHLARAVNGEIISADSMQVYKYMDIGTAKITQEEMGGIPHYLISEFNPDEEFNVVKFQKYAKKYIDLIYKKNKIPILVGGTGFYIQALLYDIDFEEHTSDTSYREELTQLAKSKGSLYLHEMLANLDPNSAKAIHPNNVKRIIRALEYIKQTGEPISAHNEAQRMKESPYQYRYFVLTKDRTKLYEAINQRVDIMIEKGLVNEVRQLLDMGYNKEMVSMQGLGYKELIDYLEDNCSLDEAIYRLKRDTRHYAKRQLTWFKREKDVTWVNKDEFSSEDEILDFMLQKLKESAII